MSILSRKVALLGKLETTYGQDSLPTVTDNLITGITDLKITPNVTEKTRNYIRPTLSPAASLPTKKTTSLTFSVELKGAGTNTDANGNVNVNKPKVVDVLQACGMAMTEETATDASSNSYTTGYKLLPTSSNFQSMTFYVYMDGILYKVLGAMGNAKVSMVANDIGKIDFTFTGLYSAPTDEAFPDVPCVDSMIPPLIRNVNLTMGGYAPVLSSFDVDLQNTVVSRDDLNAVEGVGDIFINGRNTQTSLNPDLTTVATYDVWSKFENGTAQEITGTVGSEQGNQITVDIPEAIINKLDLGDRDSVIVSNITASCQGCDSELSIEFK